MSDTTPYSALNKTCYVTPNTTPQSTKTKAGDFVTKVKIDEK